MLIAALIVIANKTNQKQPTCQCAREWISNLCIFTQGNDTPRL